MELKPGERVGDLEILRPIGRGAFSVVYLARDTLIDRIVALKVLTGTGTLDRDGLLREARLVGGLTHANIVTLYRVHEPRPGVFAFEMEHVDGGSLEEMLQRTRTPRPARADVLRILEGVLAGLDAAHAHGVLHGDIKPGNVLLGKDGSVKIADFGLGGFLGEAYLDVSTGGRARGTPHYMPPEILLSEEATSASDIWSVGVLLYRMLAGRLPFDADDLPGLFYAVQYLEPPSLPRDVPADLGGLTSRCLIKRAADRPAAIAELRTLVAQMASRTGEAVPLREAPTPALGPLLDRASELAELSELAAEAAAGEGRFVLVTGEGGVGKTRLLAELRSRTAAQGFRWIDATLTPVGGLPSALLRGARRILAASQHGAALLTAARFGTAAAVLRELVASERPPDARTSPHLVWALERLVLGLAEDAPVGLLVEEARLAGSEDVLLLKQMSVRLAEAPVLVVVALRTADPAADGGLVAAASLAGDASLLPSVAHLTLGPLPEEAVYDLLLLETGARSVAPEVAARVLRQSGGNPLYAAELLRHLLTHEAVVVEDAHLATGGGWDEAELPPRLRDLVARRMKGLTEGERQLLEVAAVDGVEFDAGALTAVLDRPLLDILRSLQRLYREHRLVLPQPSGFRFSHALFQEVLYEDIAEELRLELHRRIGRHLEERAEEHGIDPERIGLHWERAGERDRAAPYLRQAALDATRHQQYMRALDLAERSGVLSEGFPHEAIRENDSLLLALVGVYLDLSRHEEARRLVTRIAASAEALGDPVLRRRADVWRVDAGVTDGAEERALLAGAVEKLPESADMVRGLRLLARIARAEQRAIDARSLLERARTVAETHGIADQHSSVLHALGQMALADGEYESAEKLFAESARIAHAVGKATNATISELHVAACATARGALDVAEHVARAAVQALSTQGAVAFASHAKVQLAETLHARGKTLEAQAVIEDAVQDLQRIGNTGGLVDALPIQAWLAGMQGDLERARACLRRLRQLARGIDLVESVARSWAYETALCCFEQDLDAAARAAEESLALFGPDVPAGVPATHSFYLAQAGLFGLPQDSWATLHAGIEQLPEPRPTILEEAIVVFRGVSALRTGQGGSAPLRAAAGCLRAPEMTQIGPESEICAAWLEAEAHRREGDEKLALTAARDALESAHRLRHVWLEYALLRLVGELGEDPEDARRLQTLLGRQADRWPDARAQARFLEAWKSGRAVAPLRT